MSGLSDGSRGGHGAGAGCRTSPDQDGQDGQDGQLSPAYDGQRCFRHMFGLYCLLGDNNMAVIEIFRSCENLAKKAIAM